MSPAYGNASGKKGPGDRIETRCNRCNDITGHIIVALVDGAIVKVECCACGSVHKYHSPRVSKAAEGSAVRRVRSGESRTPQARASRTERDAANAEQAWRAALERPSLPASQPYSTTIQLRTDDVVEHPTFGLGVVQNLIRPDKAEILFRDGLRTMRCVCAQ